MRGRPRKYDEKDVRLRITLPGSVVKWLGRRREDGVMITAPVAARGIILKKYTLASK